ncbi:unnamed protein product, partial [Discosporangium mesarthrocarpum]
MLREDPSVVNLQWRLLVRDLLSMRRSTSGESWVFGRPLRPVKAVRVLGVVVSKKTGKTRQGGSSVAARNDAGCNVNDKERCCVLELDDGTGVVEVVVSFSEEESLDLQIEVGDQVDAFGTLVQGRKGLGLGSEEGRHVEAGGVLITADPNQSMLRSLECIYLYKTCYFSLMWTPSAASLPPPRDKDPDLPSQHQHHRAETANDGDLQLMPSPNPNYHPDPDASTNQVQQDHDLDLNLSGEGERGGEGGPE